MTGPSPFPPHPHGPAGPGDGADPRQPRPAGRSPAAEAFTASLERRLRDAEATLRTERARRARAERLRQEQADAAQRHLAAAAASVALAEQRVAAARRRVLSTARARRLVVEARSLCEALLAAADALARIPAGTAAPADHGGAGAEDHAALRPERERLVRLELELAFGRGLIELARRVAALEGRSADGGDLARDPVGANP